MICNGKKKGTMRFALAGTSTARQVAVAGDFTDWKPRAMHKREGVFSLNLTLPAGTYQYKFIVDGAWVLDPDHNQWSLSPIGTINSVVVVA